MVEIFVLLLMIITEKLEIILTSSPSYKKLFWWQGKKVSINTIFMPQELIEMVNLFESCPSMPCILPYINSLIALTFRQCYSNICSVQGLSID
jgi:hypothetical protein